MKAFQYPTFAIAVDQAGPDVWRARVEARGVRPVELMTPGEGPEERVAADLVGAMRRIFEVGVQDYMRTLLEAEPEMEEEALRRTTAALFQVAQAAGGDEPLAAAEEDLAKRMVPEEFRGGLWERAKGMFSRTYRFGDVQVSVHPSVVMSQGVIGHRLRIEGPGFVHDDLVQRPEGYLLARVAWEQLQVMKRTLEWGFERSVDHFMKVNYLEESMRPAALKFMTSIERAGKALGPARLDEITEALKAEERKEAEERQEFAGEAAEGVRAARIAELQARARELDERIREIRARRAARGPA